MTSASDVSQALASLRARWGAAAPRRWGDGAPETRGALAVAPAADPGPRAGDAEGHVVPTGFAALDEALGTGGLPRPATVALRGGAGSGRTTLALRVAAEAQAVGSIVAWLDVSRAFDPVEAVSRGVRPEWLVVLVPRDLAEALALAGSLLAARAADLLVVDLPGDGDPALAGARVGDRLGRLAALGRRSGALLVVLAPDGLDRGLAAALDGASGLRLDLRRSGWIRLGRDVVGQRCRATVARSRYGPPGRAAELDILYAEGGLRDGCLARPGLLAGLGAPAAPPGPVPVVPVRLRENRPPTDAHAPAVPALAAPAPPPRRGPPRGGRRHLRLVAARADRPGRPALDRRNGPRRRPARPGARRPAGDGARLGPPAGAGRDVPGPGA